MSWTVERLKKLTPVQRGVLRQNALRLGSEEAQEVVELIERSGLGWQEESRAEELEMA